MTTATLPTVADYERIFEAERKEAYPVIDAFEQRMGYAIDRAKLESAARVLACPLKKNPPNWQHGRVLYARTRQYLVGQIDVAMLDVGSAKGFSALCLLWALRDADILGSVTSVDVLDPNARVSRNTVTEVDGCKTLAEILEPWPEAHAIKFKQTTGLQELSTGLSRIHVCFIDGKHSTSIVLQEGRTLAMRQHEGDLAIFDDLQLIGAAVGQLEREGLYAFERLWVRKNRGYAVGVRRG